MSQYDRFHSDRESWSSLRHAAYALEWPSLYRRGRVMATHTNHAVLLTKAICTSNHSTDSISIVRIDCTCWQEKGPFSIRWTRRPAFTIIHPACRPSRYVEVLQRHHFADDSSLLISWWFLQGFCGLNLFSLLNREKKKEETEFAVRRIVLFLVYEGEQVYIRFLRWSWE